MRGLKENLTKKSVGVLFSDALNLSPVRKAMTAVASTSTLATLPSLPHIDKILDRAGRELLTLPEGKQCIADSAPVLRPL